MDQARRELHAMQAVQGAEHTVELLHVEKEEVMVNNNPYLVVVMG